MLSRPCLPFSSRIIISCQMAYDDLHHVLLDPEHPLKLLVGKARNITNPVAHDTELSSLVIVFNTSPLVHTLLIVIPSATMFPNQLSKVVITDRFQNPLADPLGDWTLRF